MHARPPHRLPTATATGCHAARRAVLRVLLLGPCLAGGTGARASIQAWEDQDAIHLSNVDAPQEGADQFEEAPDPMAPPLVGLRPDPARPAIPVAPGDIDLGRLVAHDVRTAERLARYAPLVSSAARTHGVQAALLQAVVAVESAYNPQARSRKGAIGLMQVMPATGARYGIRDLYDPRENLRAGSLYLKDLLHLFHENVDLAVAAYNAGENAVLRHGNRIPPYPETLRYVPQVVEIYRGLLR